MEFEPPLVAWRSRSPQDKVIDVTTVNYKDGSKSLLITTRDEVIEYCPHTRKYLNHWTFRTGSHASLTHGAVRHPISHSFFGLRLSTTGKTGKKKSAGKSSECLVTWRTSDADPAQWKHVTLAQKSAVFGLYVHPQLTSECVVVCANGVWAIYDEALQLEVDSSAVQSTENVSSDAGALTRGQVLWASLASTHRNPMKGSLLLSMVVQRSGGDSSSMALVVYEINKKKSEVKEEAQVTLLACHELGQGKEAATTSGRSIVNCAFHIDSVSYSLLWSDGSWQMVSFHHDPVTERFEFQADKQMATLLSTPSTAPSSTAAASPKKKRKLTTMENTQADQGTCFATGVGSFSYVIATTSRAPTKLAGWDARFGVQISTSEFDASSVKQMPSALGRLIRLATSLNGDMVVSIFEGAVVFQHLKNKHSTLASVLGAGQQTSTAAANMALQLPPQPKRRVDWNDATKADNGEVWEKNICSAGTEADELIKALADKTATPTASAFMKKLEQAMACNDKDSQGPSYRFLLTVTRRCIESAELKLWEPLKQMLLTGRLSARAVPLLLSTLMKYDQFELLELALQHLVDIDERSIVRMLKFFLRKQNDSHLASFVSQQFMTTPSAGSKRKKSAKDVHSKLPGCVDPVERFVVALLALPTNSVFLHHAIRELSVEEALLLLAICKKYVMVLFTKTAGRSEMPNGSQKATESDETASVWSELHALLQGPLSSKFVILGRLPSATQFTQWICALVDAHFAQLVMAASSNRSIAASLEQLQSVVQWQLSCASQYEHVRGVLGNFLSGINLPQAHGIPEYSIEELRL